MVFGEIVEPSSRALWEDDFIEFPEEEGSALQWQGTLEVPQVLNQLIIGETTRITSLLQRCVLQAVKPLCELIKTGIHVYRVENDSYVITYRAEPEVIVGKVTEELIPWLKVAKNIYVITSGPLSLFQNCSINESVPCVIRSLSSRKSQSTYPRLEVPNLITGLSASILSYCIHSELPCTLFIAFIEEGPLDSLNTKPLLELLRQIGVSHLMGYILHQQSPSNNLYM